VASTGSAPSRLGANARRFSTLVILCTIAGAGAGGLLSYASPPAYSGSGVYLVPPGTGAQGGDGLTPFDAERIARTYAVVIAEDEDLLDDLGQGVRRDADDVADRIQAVTLPSSSAIRVTYRGRTRAEVRTFFTTLTDAVEASTPPTENLRPDTVRLLQAPQDIERSGGGTPAAPIAGGLAGLLLGLAGAALLGRTDPRVADAADLREPGGPSVVDVDLADEGSVEALVMRALEGHRTGSRVAVVSTSERSRGQAEALAGRLDDVMRRLITDGELPPKAGGTLWAAASLGGGRGERVAQDSARTVLVVPAGASLRDVAGRLADLRDLGVSDIVLSVVRG
jgi:hypothetical protein